MLAAALAGAAVAVAIAVVLFRRPLALVDSSILLVGTEHQLTCLGRAHFVDCGALFESHVIGMDWFPVFQHLPDAAFHGLGLSPSGRIRGLGWLSVASFAGVLAIGVRALRREALPRSAALFALAMVAGPMLVYAHSAFGEMLAAFLIAGLAASALRPERPWLVGIAALAASLTKETAAPIVFAVGALGLDVARTRRPVEVRRAGLALVLGTVTGLLGVMLFNVFRFGSVENPVYSYFAARGPSFPQYLVSFGGLFGAPNAGLLWFWPVATVLLGGAAVAPFLDRRDAARRATARDPVPDQAGVAGADPLRSKLAGRLTRPIDPALRARWHAAAALAILVAVNLSLANWWSPYGWFGWGPRLTLPWVPGLLLLGLAGAGRRMDRLLDRALGTGRRATAVGVAVGITALPHLGVLVRSHAVREFFTSFKAYPGRPRYYDVVNEFAFGRFPALISALRGLASPAGVILTVALLWVAVHLTRAAARSAADRPPPLPPGDPGGVRPYREAVEAPAETAGGSWA